MTMGLFLGALLVMLPGLALAEASVPTIPDTPARQTLGSWLDAFNSADRAREDAFIAARDPQLDLNYVARRREETGGYDLLDIYASEQTTVIFRVKARKSAEEEIGRIKVSATAPSAAEDLSYVLKNLRRATLIGETTGGGAHQIQRRRIDNHFFDRRADCALDQPDHEDGLGGYGS